jgi:hypothetical protein
MTFNKSRLASGSILVVGISLLVFASACGGSKSSGSAPVTALPSTTTTLTATPNSVTLGGTTTLTASVSSTTAGTITGTVTFKVGSATLGTATVSGGTATLSNVSTTNGFSVGSNSITANYSGDTNFGALSGSATLKVVGVISTTCGSSAPNCATLTVDGGPIGGYVNAAFTDVTVCVPGMTGPSNCATVHDVLVDTGSVGLRLMKSLVPIALTQSKATGGGALTECYPFVASYMWGPVATADIHIAGETASSALMMLIDDTATAFAVPSTCSSYGGPPPLLSANSVSDLGANGILGIGSTQQDCGPYCAKIVSSQLDPSGDFVGLYYSCANSSCSPVAAAINSQVPQPVSQFATDNNGTAIDLPTVPSTGAATVTGALYFGIGTQFSNPMPSAATVLKLDASSDITTKYNSTTNTHSYIDSGSNGYFFADSNITECDINSAGSGWFCPASTFTSSATNSGLAGSSGVSTVPFSLESASTLFTNDNGNDYAFNDLGALGAAGTFDWGLPFFYGRVVFNAIEQKTVTNSGGTTFTGPFVAY